MYFVLLIELGAVLTGCSAYDVAADTSCIAVVQQSTYMLDLPMLIRAAKQQHTCFKSGSRAITRHLP